VIAFGESLGVHFYPDNGHVAESFRSQSMGLCLLDYRSVHVPLVAACLLTYELLGINPSLVHLPPHFARPGDRPFLSSGTSVFQAPAKR